MEKSSLKQILNEQLARFISLPKNYIDRPDRHNKIFNYDEPSIIMGVRRSGKSFLMKMIAAQEVDKATIGYLDLDDPRLSKFSSEDFQTAYQIWLEQKKSKDQSLHIFLDEPQNVIGWEKWVNFFASEKQGKVIITGSNAKMLSSDMATYLTGRHRELNIYPFSFKELLSSIPNFDIAQYTNNKTSQNLALLNNLFDEYLQFGGFPKAFLDKDTQILQQYYKDILYKDIIPRIQSNRSKEFLELGSFLLSHYSNLTNKTKLAANIGLKQPRTVNRYISAFIDAYLFFEIRMFSPSLKKQTRSLSKFYSIDHCLARANSFSVLDDKSSTLENLVFLELKRKGYEVFYWKSEKNNWQVDFIARKPGSEIIAVQACLSINDPAVLNREARALKAVKDELGISNLTLIVLEKSLYDPPDTNGIKILCFIDWILELDSF